MPNGLGRPRLERFERRDGGGPLRRPTGKRSGVRYVPGQTNGRYATRQGQNPSRHGMRLLSGDFFHIGQDDNPTDHE